MTALWTAETVVQATGGTTEGDWVACWRVDRHSHACARRPVRGAGRPKPRCKHFVAQAFERGAVAAVVSRLPEGDLDPAGLCW